MVSKASLWKHHTNFCKEDDGEISVFTVRHGNKNPNRENPRSQVGTENPIQMHEVGFEPLVQIYYLTHQH